MKEKERRNPHPVVEVKFKKLHEDAVVPSYAYPGDGGLDLTAVSIETDHRDLIGGLKTITYSTGLAIQLPPGYVGLLFPRSSVYKTDLTLANCVGVLDSNYLGEVKFKFRLQGRKAYEVGDRVGQLIIMPYPKVIFEEVEELDDTERGDGGFGSSGS